MTGRGGKHGRGEGDPGESWDPPAHRTSRTEQENVRRLIRICALFVATPTTTIGWALFLYPEAGGAHAHPIQMTIFIALGFVALAVWALAPRLASRWVPEP